MQPILSKASFWARKEMFSKNWAEDIGLNSNPQIFHSSNLSFAQDWAASDIFLGHIIHFRYFTTAKIEEENIRENYKSISIF